MNEHIIDSLLCPGCSGELKRREKSLACDGCAKEYPVKSHIPRFVQGNNYASSFGVEWNAHARTQIDKFNGTTISRDRFSSETGWPQDLSGERILEAGCGAGRFTQIALETGAEVWSFDMSNAVDASFLNNGPADKFHLFQADLLAPPFRKDWFDKVFCFGVLQHTPDPRQAFLNLVSLLKEGGEIVVDTYNKNSLGAWFHPKYYMRRYTRNMDSMKLYRMVCTMVPRLLPISNTLRKIPLVGRPLSLMVPVANYRGLMPIDEEQVLDWAILDTFDWLSPTYDTPQTTTGVTKWFAEAGLENIKVTVNGLIVGRGTKHA